MTGVSGSAWIYKLIIDPVPWFLDWESGDIHDK